MNNSSPTSPSLTDPTGPLTDSTSSSHATTTTTTPVSDSSSLAALFLPTEIWGQVFEKIQKPFDLLNVILTCREFYDAGIRPLYRRVYYAHPLGYVANRLFWKRKVQGQVGLSAGRSPAGVGNSSSSSSEGTFGGAPLRSDIITGFPLVPRSLVLGISWMNNAVFSRYDPSIAVVEADGEVSFSQILPGAAASAAAAPPGGHVLYSSSSSSVYNSYPSYAPSSLSSPSSSTSTSTSSSTPSTPNSPSPSSSSSYASDFYTSRQIHYFASDALFDSITSHTSQFTMLTELIFHNAHLPLSVYSMIKCFPVLENLFFYDCFLPLRYSMAMQGHHHLVPAAPPNPAAGDVDDDHVTVNIPPVPERLDPLSVLPTAPIRRLAIWNVRNEADHMPHAISSFRYILRLVRLPSLRVLHIDWTYESAAYLRNLMDRRPLDLNNGSAAAATTTTTNTTSGAQFPTGITELGIRMPPQYAWPADMSVARSRLIDPLVAFLSHPNLHNVTCLEIVNRLPGCPLPLGALPNLRIYSGPHTSVLDIATYRNLAHVEFKDEDKKTLDVITLLPDLKKVAPGLRSLSVPLRKWDEEILYPTTGFWPQLRKLKITYEEDHPSEYTILSLGARFLLNLPHLHTFQLYNPLYTSTDLPSSFKQAHFSVVGGPSLTFSPTSHPASTNFEELAFPPSQTLHVSHRLVKSQPLARRWHSGSSQLHLNTLPGHPLHHQHLHTHIGQPHGHHHHHHHHHQYTHHTHNTASNMSPSPASASRSSSTSSSASSGGSGVYPPSSSLGPQAGPLSEVNSYLAAWRKHCKPLRRVQFVKDLMWRRWDEDMPWVPVEVEEENGIRLVDYGCE